MNCLKCNGVIDETKEKSIKCDGCGRLLHITCSELSTNELKCYELRPSSKRRLKYICIDCEQGVHQIPKLISMIAGLTEDVRKLKEEAVAGCGPSMVSQSMVNSEEIISEMMERSRRSANLIIYGVLEAGSTKQEQATQDAGMIRELLNELEIPEENIKPYRLGKYDATKQLRSRPIRVKLSSSEAVQRVMQKFYKVKSAERFSKFSKLSVSPDRTPHQIAYYKAVKADLNTRLGKGETNIKIKYMNGVPTIVSSGN